jgi:hypothetical protein
MKWDVNNPDHRRALEASRAWGVSPSRFMGAPVVYMRNITTGAMVETAPAWTADDRQAAMALLDYEASLCSGCGHPLEETTDPDKEFKYRAQMPVRCHRCTASAQAMDSFQDMPHPEALHIPVILREKIE